MIIRNLTMKKMIVAGVFILFTLGAGAVAYESQRSDERGDIQDSTSASRVVINLAESGFEPRRVRISAGTEVVFTTTRETPFWPASNLHPSHAIYPELDPQQSIAPHESWSFVFTKKGTWGFHDHIRSYFTGTVYVE